MKFSWMKKVFLNMQMALKQMEEEQYHYRKVNQNGSGISLAAL